MEQKGLRIVEAVLTYAGLFFIFIGIIFIGIGLLSHETLYYVAGICCFWGGALSGWFVAYMNGETGR
jgi:hypothetical protein